MHDKIKETFAKLRTFVKQSRIEETSSKLIITIEYFFLEKKSLDYLSAQEKLYKLSGDDSILNELRRLRNPNSANSLHVLLNDIINQQFSIPKNENDTIAFMALYLLCLGTETYVSVLSFLISGYSYLAYQSYQKSFLGAWSCVPKNRLLVLMDYTSLKVLKNSISC